MSAEQPATKNWEELRRSGRAALLDPVAQRIKLAQQQSALSYGTADRREKFIGVPRTLHFKMLWQKQFIVQIPSA
jgi:hypothetical protein